MSFSLILPYNSKPFLDRIVMCNEKWILYDNQWWPTQCLDHEKAPKYFQMPNLHQKISWSLFGSLMPIWYTPDIWIPVKPLHLRSMYAQPVDEMHSTLQHLQPALVNRKGPILLHNKAQPHFAQPMVEKLNELGYKVLPHLPYSLNLFPFDYHFFKHLDNLCREKASILAGFRKCFLRVCQIPKHRFLYYSNKQTFFISKKCVVCHDSYFD